MFKPELADRLRQPVDMGSFPMSGGTYVGDFDSVVYNGSDCIVFVELKLKGKDIKMSQVNAYTAMVTAAHLAGMRACFIFAYHNVQDKEEVIHMRDTNVQCMWFFDKDLGIRVRHDVMKMKTGELIDMFLKGEI